MRAGMSANQGLKALREAGAGVRRDTFLRAWGEVANDLAQRPVWQTRDLGAPVLPSELPEWHAARPGMLGYTGRVVVRDRATGVLNVKDAMVFSTNAMAPQDALDQMISDFQEGAQTGTAEDVVVTAYFVQAYQMMGRE